MNFKLNTGEILDLKTIVLDLNGTLAVHGKISFGVKKRLKRLKKLGFKIILLSGDARHNAERIAKKLNIDVKITKDGKEKIKFMKTLNKEEIISIGNARIDSGMFTNSKIKILTLQAEGIHASLIEKVDIVVPSIKDALDLFIDKNNFLATMKI